MIEQTHGFDPHEQTVEILVSKEKFIDLSFVDDVFGGL